MCKLSDPVSDENRRRLGGILDEWDEKDLQEVIEDRESTLAQSVEALHLAHKEGIVSALIFIYLRQFYVHAAYADTEPARLAATNALEALARIRGWSAAKRHWISDCAEDPAKWEGWGTWKTPIRKRRRYGR